MFDVGKFQSLRSGQFGTELHFYQEVDSTNRVAIELARQRVSEGTVVLADCQTAGRGRNSHHWYSPAGLNLYCTIVLYPPAELLHYLPFISAISVAETLEAIGVRCDLKWPNDILSNRKKIAGILIQTSVEENRLHFAVAGIGINVNAPEFPPELTDVATSVLRVTGRATSREEMLVSFLAGFENLYGRLPGLSWDELSEAVARRSSYVRNCDVQIEQQGKLTTGKTVGLDPLGGLILETERGREVFYAGEIAACRKK